MRLHRQGPLVFITLWSCWSDWAGKGAKEGTLHPRKAGRIPRLPGSQVVVSFLPPVPQGYYLHRPRQAQNPCSLISSVAGIFRAVDQTSGLRASPSREKQRPLLQKGGEKNNRRIFFLALLQSSHGCSETAPFLSAQSPIASPKGQLVEVLPCMCGAASEYAYGRSLASLCHLSFPS